MINGMEHLETIFDRVEYLQNFLVDEATGNSGVEAHFQSIRVEILDNLFIQQFHSKMDQS